MTTPSTRPPTAVSADLDLRLMVPGAAAVPVRAALHFDPSDPYAVRVTFRTGGTDGSESVEWTFARQLLADGTGSCVGEGDVQAWPAGAGADAAVCLALSSPSGRALFEVPLRALSDFLARTYDQVPAGTEGAHVDLDAELALLLWAEPGI